MQIQSAGEGREQIARSASNALGRGFPASWMLPQRFTGAIGPSHSSFVCLDGTADSRRNAPGGMFPGTCQPLEGATACRPGSKAPEARDPGSAAPKNFSAPGRGWATPTLAPEPGHLVAEGGPEGVAEAVPGGGAHGCGAGILPRFSARTSMWATPKEFGRTPIPSGMALIPKGMSSIPSGMTAIPDGMSPVPSGMTAIPKGMEPREEGMAARETGMAARETGMAAIPSGMAPRVEGMASIPSGIAPRVEGMASIPSGMAPRVEGMASIPFGMAPRVEGIGHAPFSAGRPQQGPGSSESLSGRKGWKRWAPVDPRRPA